MRSIPGRRRWRWLEDFDITSPRPADYAVAVAAFLLLGLLFVWERNHAIVLNRDVFRLQEQISALRNETDRLASEATELADRQRIVKRAEELGMVFPHKGELSWIYWVPHPTPVERSPRGRVAGFVMP
jgi:cell division protein FtsL